MASAQLTVPSGCESYTDLTLTSFTWFNSSHNLDCANPNYSPTDTYCVNQTNTGAYELCDGPAAPEGTTPGPGECTACYGMCGAGATWFPGITDQPLGYGPPDVLNTSLCSYTNPVLYAQPQYEIGEGPTGCGASSQVVFEFWGDSSQEEGGVGKIWYYPEVLCGLEEGGYRILWEGEFPLHCTRDSQNNATCTVDLPLVIPLVAFVQ